jgi:hypothetical protein
MVHVVLEIKGIYKNEFSLRLRTRSQVNVMGITELELIMTDVPLLTMVKKQILAEKPALSKDD